MIGDYYDAKDLKAWCDEHGIETHDFRDAPTSFVLYKRYKEKSIAGGQGMIAVAELAIHIWKIKGVD